MPEACLADGFRFATCVWEIDGFKSPSTLDCSTISFRMCCLVFCRVLAATTSLCSPPFYFHNLLYSSQRKKRKSRNPCVQPHLKSCSVRNSYCHYEQSFYGQIRIYECETCMQASASVYLHRACDLVSFCLCMKYDHSVEPSCCQHCNKTVCSYLQRTKKRQRLWNLKSACARRELMKITQHVLQLHINIQHRDGRVSRRRRRRRRPVKAVALPPRQRRAVVWYSH